MAQDQYTIALDREDEPLVEEAQEALKDELNVNISKKDTIRKGLETIVEGSA